MKVAITGASGLIGKELSQALLKLGMTVIPMVRIPKAEGIYWSPNNDWDPTPLNGVDVVIHLAGESINSRWTKKKKEQIYRSRVEGTRNLSKALATLDKPPQLFLSASAIGYYGNRPDEQVDESSTPGSGFLAEVVNHWEKATEPAEQAGIRTVHLRFGMVLSTKGGALPKLMLPFQLGIGGKQGSGKQMISWIALPEIPRIVAHLIHHHSISGPVNVVSPNPVPNEEFARKLGSIFRRTAWLPVPGFLLKLLMGQMAEELILWGAHVVPRKLLESGYRFEYADLKQTLFDLILGANKDE